ncbi:oligosaccharide flippase family protein [Anthocerotibacter panamensis]|uniref:oligosaccharide flippase family protein n=1 Tax=Anthocerotibacter panamensis TaxID=2857077 RepID=UPI001C406674|nr:oligosaccharide flippase family protein [Anthocerotibacter panamensis]
MTRFDRRIAGGSLWLGGSFALAKGLQLGAQVLLARLLLPTDFGLWAMVLVVHTLSGLFRDTAIAQVLVQRGLEDRRRTDAVYSLGVNVALALGALQALAGFPLAQFFGVAQLWPLAAAAGLVFVLGAGAGAHGAVLQRELKFRELALCDLGSTLARFGVALALAALGLGVWSFVWGELAAGLVDALLKRYWSGYRFHYQRRLDPEALREVRGFVMGILAINLAVQANTNGDNLVIGRLLGTQALGYYSVAYQLAMVPVFALSQINRVNFAVLAQKDRKQQGIYLTQALELYALAAAPVYAIAWLVAPWAIPLLYGSPWQQAVPVFQGVLIFAYARGFMALLGTALNALDRTGVNAAINWALVPLSIPAYILGAHWGIAGVAVAVALVMGVGATGWFWWATCRSAGWPLDQFSRAVLFPTGAAILATLGAFAFAPGLQPGVALFLYGGLITVGSRGAVPRRLAKGLSSFSARVGDDAV